MENKSNSVTDRLCRNMKLRYHKMRRWVVYGRIPRNKDLDAHVCMNCDAHYQGHYCPDCGQVSTETRLKPSNALKNFLGGLTNIDRGFPRTCIELLTRPGYMIADFIAGKRVDYFKPFQMLFVLAMVYGIFSFMLNPNENKKKLSESLFSIATPNATFKDSTEVSSDSLHVGDAADRKALKEDSVKKTVTVDLSASDEEGKLLEEVVTDLIDVTTSVTDKIKVPGLAYVKAIAITFIDWINENRAMQTVLFLPLAVIAASWSFRKKWNVRRYNWVELTFVHGYIACQSLLISILMLPFARSVDATLPPYWLSFLLHVWCYYQLFKGSLKSIFGRTIVVYLYMALIGIITLTLILALFVLMIYLLVVLL